MVLSPLRPSVESSSDPRRTSSSPPGQKGTYPDLPLTKLFVGAGARFNEVDVRPVDTCVFGIYYFEVKMLRVQLGYFLLTWLYPVTRPSRPVRTKERLVGGGEGSKPSSDGTDILCSQWLRQK